MSDEFEKDIFDGEQPYIDGTGDTEERQPVYAGEADSSPEDAEIVDFDEPSAEPLDRFLPVQNAQAESPEAEPFEETGTVSPVMYGGVQDISSGGKLDLGKEDADEDMLYLDGSNSEIDLKDVVPPVSGFGFQRTEAKAFGSARPDNRNNRPEPEPFVVPPPAGAFIPPNGGGQPLFETNTVQNQNPVQNPVQQPAVPAGYIPVGVQSYPPQGYVYQQPQQGVVYHAPTGQTVVGQGPVYGYGTAQGYVQQSMPAQQQFTQPAYAGAATAGVSEADTQKRKKPLGLKVFLWVLSILAVGTILGFTGYVTYSAMTGSPGGSNITDNLLPGFGDGGSSAVEGIGPDSGDNDDIPDFDDGVIPPDANTVPDISVVPNNEGINIAARPTSEELTADQVYEKVSVSTVTVVATMAGYSIEDGASTGTGIVATADGYIITNSHVVLNSKSSIVKIITIDGEEYDAVVVGVDRTTDLAVLKTNDHQFTPAEFGDADDMAIGEWVIAIGTPGGERFSSSLTRGVISGLNRTVGQYSENGMTFIQTDAAINPGNSGGPLVNMHGQVIGINSSKIITSGYEGMGFAIPVSKAQTIINELLSGGYVKGRTRLGIKGQDVTSVQASLYNAPMGFRIDEIDADSAFAGTEAAENDIIIAIGGDTVSGLNDISNLLLGYAPGDQVTVTLYRMSVSDLGKGQEIEVTITLLEDKGETQN